MNQQQKQEFLDQSRAHYAADMLIKGMYGDVRQDQFKGCSVGCHLKHIDPVFDGDNIEDKHTIVAEHYGYPAWLAHLQDDVFEGLPNGESARWHVQLAETLYVLPDGYDWQAAMHRVHVAILRIARRTAGSAQDVVQAVIDLHERALSGEAIGDVEWLAVQSAARRRGGAEALEEAAVRSAVLSAEYSAARRTARSTACWVRWAARWAARSVEYSTAGSTAGSKAYQEIRDGVLAALSNHHA